MKPGSDPHQVMQVLASEYGVNVTPAAGLAGQALCTWIEEQEDDLARLFRKMSYMRNCTAAERSAAYDRLMEMRGDRPLPENL